MSKQEAKTLGYGRVIEVLPREKDGEPQGFLQRIKNSGRGLQSLVGNRNKVCQNIGSSHGQVAHTSWHHTTFGRHQRIIASAAAVMDRLQELLENTTSQTEA